MEEWKWVTWLVTLAGLGVVGYGVRELVTTRQFLERSQRTEGTIISWRSVDIGSASGPHSTPGPRTEDYATVRFEAPDGRVIETEAELPLSTRLEVGTPVTVLFNPADPRRARVSTHGGRGYFAGALSIVAGLWVAIMPHLWWGW